MSPLLFSPPHPCHRLLYLSRIHHGAYLTVIAKLGEVALPIGASIAAGDRLGRAARHRVYVEVRVKLGPGGLPIDPEPLLGKR